MSNTNISLTGVAGDGDSSERPSNIYSNQSITGNPVDVHTVKERSFVTGLIYLDTIVSATREWVVRLASHQNDQDTSLAVLTDRVNALEAENRELKADMGKLAVLVQRFAQINDPRPVTETLEELRGLLEQARPSATYLKQIEELVVGLTDLRVLVAGLAQTTGRGFSLAGLIKKVIG